MGNDVKEPTGKFDWVDDFIADVQRDMKRSSVVFRKDARALERSLARKAGGEVLSWLSEDGLTIHLTDGHDFPLKKEISNEISVRFYRFMFENVGDGDIDEVEVEGELDREDHRKIRKDNDANKAGRPEVRLREIIEHFDELITRPSKTGKGRLRIRLKYSPL